MALTLTALLTSLQIGDADDYEHTSPRCETLRLVSLMHEMDAGVSAGRVCNRQAALATAFRRCN